MELVDPQSGGTNGEDKITLNSTYHQIQSTDLLIQLVDKKVIVYYKYFQLGLV